MLEQVEPYREFVIRNFTPELAGALGFLVGDGSVYFPEWKMTFCNANLSLLSAVREQRAVRGFAPFAIYVAPISLSVRFIDERPTSIFRFDCYKKDFVEACFKYVPYLGHPWAFRYWLLDVLKSPRYGPPFIAQYWDADGSIRLVVRPERVDLVIAASSRSPMLFWHLRRLLLHFGVVAHRKEPIKRKGYVLGAYREWLCYPFVVRGPANQLRFLRLVEPWLLDPVKRENARRGIDELERRRIEVGSSFYDENSFGKAHSFRTCGYDGARAW